jgi:hypothetical protein
MTSSPILPQTVWYAPGDDSHIFERVQVLGSVVFPTWGRFILYKQIDWPDSGALHPICTHEETFRLLYTPQESETCAIQLPGNSFSKTSWRARLSSFFARLKPWKKTPIINPS